MFPIRVAYAFAAISMALPGTFAGNAVQMDVKKTLNCRMAWTYVNGHDVKWVGGGIERDSWSFWATASYALAHHGTAEWSLPDDGVFPADADHPQVVLNILNSDSVSMQVRRMPDADTFSFAVPPHKYTRLQIFTTTGDVNGTSDLTCTMTYSDNSTTVSHAYAPDYYKRQNPPNGFVLKEMDKYSRTGGSPLEYKGHFCYGLNLSPDKNKVMTKLSISKTSNGNVCFMGATGETDEATVAFLAAPGVRQSPLAAAFPGAYFTRAPAAEGAPQAFFNAAGKQVLTIGALGRP